MESIATKERSKAVRATHSAHNRLSVGTTKDVEKTPESELIEVDEYFGILHKMVDEYYDSIQG